MAAAAPPTTGPNTLTDTDQAFIASAILNATSGGPVGPTGPAGKQCLVHTRASLRFLCRRLVFLRPCLQKVGNVMAMLRWCVHLAGPFGDLNASFTLSSAYLVFFMHCGFAMVTPFAHAFSCLPSLLHAAKHSFARFCCSRSLALLQTVMHCTRHGSGE